MLATTRQSTGSDRIYWSDDQYQEIAAEMARIKFEDITCHSFTGMANMAMKNVIDKEQWRDLIMVPDGLKRMYATACEEYREQFVLKSLIEIPEPIVDVDRALEEAPMEKLLGAYGRRMDQMAGTLHKVATTPPTVNLVQNVQAIPSIMSPVPKPQNIRVAVIGLLPGQVKSLEADLKHHLVPKGRLVLKPFAINRTANVPSTFRVDHAICFNKVRHADFDHARDWLPYGRTVQFLHGMSEIREAIKAIMVPGIKMPVS